MNVWLLIWVFVVVFICGVFLWSLQILFRQKAAWSDFSKKNGLEFTRGGMMKSPVVNGLFRGMPLLVYSEEQPTPDQRGRRFRTVLQFQLPGRMPVEGIVATPENHLFAMGLTDLTEDFRPRMAGFPESIMIRTRNADTLATYMTDERVRALQTLMTIKSIPGLFIFDLNATYLRFETSDPMAETGKLERLAVKIADHAKVLLPK